MRNPRASTIVLVAAMLACAACLAVGGWMLLRDRSVGDEYAQIAAEAKEEAPTEDGEEGAAGIDWDSLLAQNPDLAGWLTVEGTSIDLPVVRAHEDDPDRYLRYTFTGRRSELGCPYLNWACDPDGRVMTIYGHHIWTGGYMFHDLGTMYKSARFDSVGGAEWSTPALGTRRFEKLCCIYIKKWDDEWNVTGFASAAALREWLGRAVEESVQKVDGAQAQASRATRALVLATCSDSGVKSDRVISIFTSDDGSFEDAASVERRTEEGTSTVGSTIVTDLATRE